jgi:hypothetical protein
MQVKVKTPLARFLNSIKIVLHNKTIFDHRSNSSHDIKIIRNARASPGVHLKWYRYSFFD